MIIIYLLAGFIVGLCCGIYIVEDMKNADDINFLIDQLNNKGYRIKSIKRRY